MSLIFRLLSLLVSLPWRPGLGIDEPSVIKFRVWPLDIDINLHLTNSRYLALMDLGRTDHILRSGLWRVMRRDRLGVVLGGAAIRFRRSLRPFERFFLTTTLLGWDERWVYLEQVFTGADGVACTAVLRSAFVRHGKVVPPEGVLAAMGIGKPPPVLPDWVEKWAEVETAFVG